MNYLITILLTGISLLSTGQKKTAYEIFTKKGKKVSYEKMLSSAKNSDLILFGELHNNPIAHWLQFELITDLLKTNKLILGAEMFEADNQDVLNEYLQNKITEKTLDSTAKLWKNYKTDYAPLVNIAKENNIPFIATNIPRLYANLVYKNGFESLDSLPIKQKQWIAPLPIDYNSDLDCYKNILKEAHGHGGDNLPKAQAIKDATMAHFILKNNQPNNTFVHFNGTYHSDYFQGILYYIELQEPDQNHMTIATVLQQNTNKLSNENLNTANYIIVVDENMTTTY